MASVGQRSTQAPQPVHASRITLWICLAAPMIASVGQTLLQRQQPVQMSSATKASCGPSSAYRREVDPDTESGGDGFRDSASARRAERRCRFIARQGCRGLGAADKTALPTLRAGQQRLQFGFERILLDREVTGGQSEKAAQGNTHEG
jgi:hypothetical protein